ncbi:MAG: short-chain dehydrogenase/reductase, partial [Alphaproteobacteria bacterium]
MDLNLKGRAVLVTGASKGIGRAVAEGFAAEGCDLHLSARSTDLLAEARDTLTKDYGVAVTVHALDLAERGAAARLAADCADIDILVNNAGAIPGGSLADIDEDTWREAWDLKVFGYINLTRAIYARFKEKGGGVIVNVVGLAAVVPRFGYIAGSAGNASLDAFTRALGGGGPDDNIRVVGIHPGLIATDR